MRLPRIEAQVDHLLFDLRRAAFVGGIEQEGLVGAAGIVAAIALFPGVGLAALDYLLALTVKTSYRNESHRTPFH